jgi:hypothetical protein
MTTLRVENVRLTFKCERNRWYFLVDAVERIRNGQVIGNYSDCGHANILEIPASISELFRVYNATWKVLYRMTSGEAPPVLELAALEILGNNFDTIPTYKREESINC